MKFTYMVKSGIPLKISTVCLEVQDILMSEDFHALLLKIGRIAQSNLDGPTLSAEIKRVLTGPVKGIEVSPYSYGFWQRYYRSRVIANVGSAYPKRINLNTWFFYVNDDVDYCNTIAHETVHVIDNHSPYWFGHGSNDPTGDENTAPHIVGDLVVMLYKQRRTARLAIQARNSQESFAEALTAIGAQGNTALINMAINEASKPRGVYDHGIELGTTQKNSVHVAD